MKLSHRNTPQNQRLYRLLSQNRNFVVVVVAAVNGKPVCAVLYMYVKAVAYVMLRYSVHKLN